MKKLFVFGIVLMMIAVLFTTVITNVSASPTTYWVDKLEGDNNNEGTESEPWEDISWALYKVSSGDTIKVKNTATYYEQVYISVKVNLIGVGSSKPILDASQRTSAVITIVNPADGTTVEGFRIKNAINSGIELLGSSSDSLTNCIIKDNIIEDNYDGIECQYAGQISSGNKFYDNTIKDNYLNGIYINSNSDGNIVGQSNDGNDINQNDDHGIYIEDSKGNVIQYNDISSNSDNGIKITNCQGFLGSPTSILNNEIDGNLKIGVEIGSSKQIEINENLIYGNYDEAGIKLYDTEDFIVYKNGIYGNTGYGIFLSNCKNANNVAYGIQFNSPSGAGSEGIYGNSKDGIYVEKVELETNEYLKISDNKISGNNENGIYLAGSSADPITDVIISDNEIFNNYYDGIRMEYSYDNILDGNNIYNTESGGTITGSQDNGIKIDNSKSNTIENHDAIKYNNDHGILIENCDLTEGESNKIEDNNIHHNDGCGISIKNSNYGATTLYSTYYNEIHHNSWEGIYLYNSDYNILQKNWVYDNEEGIKLTSASNYNIIEDNEINNNDYDGLELHNSDNNEIKDNDVDFNSDSNYGIHENGHQGIDIYQSDNVLINENIVNDNSREGIRIENSIKNYIESNTINNNVYHGIYISSYIANDVDRIQIKSNEINYNDIDGINIDQSERIDIIEDNDVKWNKFNGIFIKDSKRILIEDNEIGDNGGDGIWMDGIQSQSLYNSIIGNSIYNNDADGTINRANHNGECGIYLELADGNTIEDNYIYDNQESRTQEDGIYIKSSNNNKIINNILGRNNGYGVKIDSSAQQCSQNKIYHNNFDNNKLPQAYDDTSSALNSWDNGYPTGGNWWSDIVYNNLIDDYRGPLQTTSYTEGGDGILDKGISGGGGKNPYYLDPPSKNYEDTYPLIYQVMDGRVYRPPFSINSDNDFDADRGVVSGTGDSTDPYIIEGWHIDAIFFSVQWGYCISISGTQKHFIIKDCYVYHAEGSSSNEADIMLDDVTFGVIKHNYIVTSLNTTISGNGIYMKDSDDNEIQENNFVGNTVYGVKIDTVCSNNEIIYNNFLLHDPFPFKQAYDFNSASSNSWDDGSDGNHWSDWTSPDSNSDGIVDYPYVLDPPIGGYHSDNYPQVNQIEWWKT